MAAVMLIGMGTISFAAENDSQIPVLQKTNSDGISVNAEELEQKINNDLKSWPGDGPAAQVTKIQLSDYGWLENGNFGVIIKVYGYGSDNTTFAGRKISWIQQEPFIISGTGADGFFYLYDCGSITQEGKYTFATTFTSTNFPHKQVSFSDTFTFSAN